MSERQTNNLKNLAIIPARGGSKRIPRKNIKPFLGKPIIAYSIEAALNSELFDEVMVSTNDEEIAEIAKKYGAAVPFLRSNENADHFATLADVVDEVIAAYREKVTEFEYICLILPTAPFTTEKNIQQTYNYITKNEIDSVRPVVRFSYPIQRAQRMVDGKLEMIQPEHLYTRSQDLEPAFHDAGQFYWMKADKGMRGDIKHGIEISELEVQDIDTEDDWEIAEVKYKYLKDKEK